jgi:hypothetical protein
MGRAGALARTVVPGVALGIVLATSACVPSTVRSALPGLSKQEPTYAGRWRPWFPWWYTLYSLLPGDAEPACDTPSQVSGRGPSRTTMVSSCAPVSGESLSETATTAGKAADAVEAAFRGKTRITRLGIRLVPPGTKAFERDSSFLRPHGLDLQLLATFEPANEEASRRKLVRSMAHELFHMGKRALAPWHDGANTTPPEEVAAALFESCVEDKVFGSVSRSASDPAQQADPAAFSGNADAHRSTAGNLEAAGRLARIAGVDGVISSAAEREQLEALCASLAP